MGSSGHRAIQTSARLNVVVLLKSYFIRSIAVSLLLDHDDDCRIVRFRKAISGTGSTLARKHLLSILFSNSDFPH